MYPFLYTAVGHWLQAQYFSEPMAKIAHLSGFLGLSDYSFCRHYEEGSILRHSSERSEVKESPIEKELIFIGDRWTQTLAAFQSDDRGKICHPLLNPLPSVAMLGGGGMDCYVAEGFAMTRG